MGDILDVEGHMKLEPWTVHSYLQLCCPWYLNFPPPRPRFLPPPLFAEEMGAEGAEDAEDACTGAGAACACWYASRRQEKRISNRKCRHMKEQRKPGKKCRQIRREERDRVRVSE